MSDNSRELLILNYIGNDDWARPVYKDQYGFLWKDLLLGDGMEPDLSSVVDNRMQGEPDNPIHQDFRIDTPYEKNPSSNDYSVLDMLQSICTAHLYPFNNVRLTPDEQTRIILEMKQLHNSFPENDKPLWLTWKQILDYEEKMKMVK